MYQLLVGRRIQVYGLLSETVEELATRFGAAPVETERELVKVVVQVFIPHSPLVCAQQPPFEQQNHTMHTRQQVFVLGSSTLYLSVMGVASQAHVGDEVVRRQLRDDDLTDGL